MSDTVTFNGVRYLSVSDAASHSGLNPDYVAQLCREEKIRARRIGKYWFVEEDALNAFLIMRAHARELRRADLAKSRTQEYQAREVVAQEESIQKEARLAEQSEPFRQLKERFEAALAMRGSASTQRAAYAATASPLGLAHAAYGALGHIPTHTISPVAEFLHKISALLLAFLLTFGTYALVDQKTARFAFDSMRDAYETISDVRVSAVKVQSNVAAAAENPVGTVAGAFESLARAVHRNVNAIVYSVSFSNASVGIRGDGDVAVKPYAMNSADGLQLAANSSQQIDTRYVQQTIIQQPVIERIIERAVPAQLAAVGGITEEYLNARLQELDNKLSTRVYAVTSVSSPPSSSGIANQVALAQRIDTLSSVDIADSTFASGTITGSTIRSSTISDTSIAATTFTATSATSTSLYVSGLSSLVTASTTDLTWQNATGTSATSTHFSAFTPIMAPAFNATSSSATSTFSGAAVFTRAPTVAHAFSSWTIGASNVNPFDASLFINPASATGDGNLFAAAVGGSVKFLIDAEGDLFANNLTTVGSVTLSTTSASTFTVEGNATLGDSLTDTTTVNGTLTVTGTTSIGTIAGKFGVGTTSPYAKLGVHANASDSNLLLFEIASSTASATTSLFKIDNTGLITFMNTTGSQATTTSFFSTTASSTNLFATAGTFAALTSGSLSLNSALGVSSGGTGASTLGQGWIYSNGGTGALAASTSPTVNYVVATSTSIASRFPYASSTALTATNLFSTNWTGTYASTTAFTVSGNAYFPGSGIWNSSGNLGVGTTSPGSLFSIQGIANFQTGTSTIYENLNVQGQLKVGTGSIFLNGAATSTFSAGIQSPYLNITGTSATSTFARGIDLAGGCFSVNGTCLASGITGTQGYTTTFNSSGSQVATSTLFFSTASNVGIGTTTPATLLSLHSTGNAQATLYSTAVATTSLELYTNNSYRGSIGYGPGYGGGIKIWNADNSNVTLGTNNIARLTIDSSGNVGIGTTSPTRLLSIAGIAGNAMQLDRTANTEYNAINFTNGNSELGYLGFSRNDGTGLATNGLANSLVLRSAAATHITTGASITATFNASGNVGIGVSPSAAKLEIANSSAGIAGLRIDQTGANQALYVTNSAVNNYVINGVGLSDSYAGIVVLTQSYRSGAGNYHFYAQSDSNGTPDTEFYVTNDGNVAADGTVSGGGADYAEYVTPKPGTTPVDYEKGSLICLVTSDPDTYGFCDEQNDAHVVGVISTFPAVVGNSPALATSSVPREETHILLSMLGRVPLKVSLENGPIAIGDRLTSASQPGYAMKASTTSRTIGFALENYLTQTFDEKIMLYIEPELTHSEEELAALAEIVRFASSTPGTFDVAEGSFVAGLLNNIYAQLTEWFANAANGIGEVFAKAFNASEKICIDGECLTKDDVRVLKQLAAVGAAASPPSSPPTPSESIPDDTPSPEDSPQDEEAPVISIQGNNPATINVGDSYNDLGATVEDNLDVNLGIKTFVDGTEVQSIQLDTSTSTSYTITYRATDNAGNTGEATRVVTVVEPPTQ